MSESQERKTVGFFAMYHPLGAKINFTIRDGTSPEDVTRNLQVLFDAVGTAKDIGFSLSPPLAMTKPEEGGEIDGTEVADYRTALMWVRGESQNGHPCLYAYAEDDRVEHKVFTAYSSIIQYLPITQAEWDSAKVWNFGQAPKKDRAMAEGFVNYFPAEVEVAMRDTGKTFVLQNGPRKGEEVPILAPFRVTNAEPGGVQFEDQKPPARRTQAPSTPANVNNGPGPCPQCNAPAGKPHGTGCNASNISPDQIQGVKRGFPTQSTHSQASLPDPAKGPSVRQKMTAALKVIGEALYGPEWDAVRERVVHGEGIPSGSVSDMTDEQIGIMLGQIKEMAGSFVWETAESQGLTVDRVIQMFGDKWAVPPNWDMEFNDVPAMAITEVLKNLKVLSVSIEGADEVQF